LDNTCKKERDHIVQFMKYNNANSDALLLGYVSEAMHASADIPFFWLSFVNYLLCALVGL
jgi:hypothetical protein